MMPRIFLCLGIALLGMLAGWWVGPMFHSASRGRDGAKEQETRSGGEAPLVVKEQALEEKLGQLLRGPVSIESRIQTLCVLHRWLSRNPTDALNGLYQLGGSGLLNEAEIYSALENTGGKDMRSLLVSAGEIADPWIRNRLFRQTFRQLIASDPNAALDVFSSLPFEVQKTEAKKLAEQVGKKADRNAMDSLLRHPKAAALFMGAFVEWSKTHTADAYQLIETTDERELLQVGCNRYGLISEMSEVGDIQERLRFMLRQPQRWNNMRIINDLYVEVAAKDPAQVNAIWQQIPSDARRATFASLAAPKIARRNPEMSAHLINQIGSEGLRIETAVKATESMTGQGVTINREALQKWVDSFDGYTAVAVQGALRKRGIEMRRNEEGKGR